MKAKVKKLLSLTMAYVCAAFAMAQTTDWIPLVTVGEEDGTLSNEVSYVNDHYEFTSQKYTVGGPINALRFTFKETFARNSPNMMGNDMVGYPWVCIAEFYIYDGDGNSIELTEDCFSTNAQEEYEGEMKNICDNEYGTFWHSTWTGTAVDSSYHYLEVTLPDGIALSEFSFGWLTRYVNAGNPKTVEVSHTLPLTLESRLTFLEEVRDEVESYIAVLDEMNLIGIKDTLLAEYAKTVSVDTTSVDALSDEIQRLRDCLQFSQAGVKAYNDLGELIIECDSLVDENLSEEFSSALTKARETYADINASVKDYTDAYQLLSEESAHYRIGNIELSTLYYDHEEWIDEWCVGLNTTYHVACVYECSKSDSVCVVPEIFEYNGEEYTTIGLGRYNESYWSNVWRSSYMIKSVQLPSSLRFLGCYALGECNITEVVIPKGVEYIGYRAFSYCHSLKGITIPANVSVIGECAFNSCSSLEEVVLPDSLIMIGSSAFAGCSSLKEIAIPANVSAIGEWAFNSCSNLDALYCLSTTPPVCYSNTLDEGDCIVYVPEGCAALYRSADYWENYLILEGDGVTVEVDVETPGTLGEKVLEHVDYLYEVNHLVVSGELNEVDLRRIKSAMPYLMTIDMSGVEMKTLPESMFYEHKYLMEATLPENLMVIGDNAFGECRNLTAINIPEGVIRIGHCAFVNCDGLERLVCPSTLNSIGQDAFSSCESLISVELNEGLDSLENRAFADCINLTEVVLPSSLISFSVPFNWCHNIKSVTCRALIPPYLNNNYDIFSGVDKTSCVLYVPEWTLNVYRLASGWDSFVSIMPLVGYLPENINVMGNVNLTLPESLPVDYRANVSLNYSENSWEYGSLTLNSEGECVLPVGKFHMVYDANRMYDSYNGWNETQAWYTTLINNAGMRADSISITLYNRNDVWNFFSFPYDVKVSEIVPLYANSDFVIRKYSGEERANGNMANTWQNMTADSTLRAGEGYIWHSSRYTDNWGSDNWWCGFEVPAVNNSNKNLIFANGDRTVTLNEYLSEYSHNRSWNLIGNPYPAYYDTRAMDYTAPITVWNAYNGSYYAYSPVDDEYILCPGEAFFVQRPVDTDAITFRADGRQADRVVRNRVAETRAKARNTNNRQVFNLTLSNGVKTDRTRFVINSDAARDYEMNRDANKFMSDDACIPQLYTIEGGVKYAINERPMDNGVIALGAHFGNNGSYTIALNTQVEGMSVVLVDKMTGAETDLMEDSYTFTAEAGTVNTRFEVCMKIDEEDGDAAGLESLNGKVAVKAVAGKIVVTAPYESAIEVYNAEGQRVTAVTAASATLDVEPGVYVVKVQDAVHKVSVAR